MITAAIYPKEVMAYVMNLQLVGSRCEHCGDLMYGRVITILCPN